MHHVGYNFYFDLQRWSLDSLTEYLLIPHDPVEEAVNELTGNKLIIETGDDPPYLVPARSIEKITLKEIIDSTRTNYETDVVEKKYLSMPEVDLISGKVDNAIDQALGDLTLKDLILAGERTDD